MHHSIDYSLLWQACFFREPRPLMDFGEKCVEVRRYAQSIDPLIPHVQGYTRFCLWYGFVASSSMAEEGLLIDLP